MEEEEKKSDFDVFKGKVFSFTYELVSNEVSSLLFSSATSYTLSLSSSKAFSSLGTITMGP